MTDKDKQKAYVQRTAVITPKKAVLSDFMNERYSEALELGSPVPNHAPVNPIKDCLIASFVQTPTKKPLFFDT